MISTIELPTPSLSPIPAPYEEWLPAWSDYSRVYNRVFKAECDVLRQAGDNVTFTRTTGYLPIEPFGRRAIFSEGTSTSLARRLESKSVGNGDLILRISELQSSFALACIRFPSYGMGVLVVL